jgi:hypothetical protein
MPAAIEPMQELHSARMQLRNSLKSPLAAFKCASLFSPEKVNHLKPDATVLQEYLSVVPFFNAQETVLQEYLSAVPFFNAQEIVSSL